MVRADGVRNGSGERALGTAVPPDGNAAASGELLAELAHDLALLVRTELELQRLERAAAGKGRARSAVALLGGAFAGAVALVAFSSGLAQALALALPSWAASLVVAIAWAVPAILLLRSASFLELVRGLLEPPSPLLVASMKQEELETEERLKSTAKKLAAATAAEAMAAAVAGSAHAVEAAVAG